MRNAQLTALVLVALVSCSVAPALGATPRGGPGVNENGDDWAAVTSSAFSVAPLHVGDQAVGLTVVVHNQRPGDSDVSNGDERMYNVTLEAYGVEDANGKLLSPQTSPLAWKVSRSDNDGYGIPLGHSGEGNSSYSFTGLSFDVNGIGAHPGKYNVSVRISYSMMTSWSLASGAMWDYLSEEEDNIQFEIMSNIRVGAPVAYDDSLSPMPLYAGASFQLIGVPVTTLSGPLDQLVASISVPTTSALKLSAPAGTVLTTSLPALTGTAVLYFRVDVPMADPGVYNASNANITLTVQFIREQNWNGSLSLISASESGHLLEFTVDYTPLLNATAVAPASFTRGSPVQNLTVTLKNEGNADVVRVSVSLDVSNYFTGGAYFYDGDGNRVSVPLEQTISQLKHGETTSVSFPMAVFSGLPAGTHRLPVRYSGYYERSGGSSFSSGLYAMTDALFRQLRGGYPFVDITVRDTAVRLAVSTSMPSSMPLNPDGESQGLVIGLAARNDEKTAFRDVTFTILAGNGTVLRNPVTPASGSLDPVRMSSLGPGQTAELDFVADMDRTAAAGFQQLTLRFNATGADSNQAVGLDQKFTVRISPFGPAIDVGAGGPLRLGGQTRGVIVPLTVLNSGGAVLSDIGVTVRAGAPSPLLNPSDPSQQWLEPGRMSVLEPLSSSGLGLMADIDANATAQTYQVGVEVTGRYFATGESFTFSDTFLLRILPAPARLALQSTTIDPVAVQPGKSFTLTVLVKNVGGDTARDVVVALGDLAGQLPGAGASSATGLGGGEEPFSAEVAVKYVGDIRPGDQVSVAFNVLTEANAPGGRVFREPVVLGSDGQNGSTQYQTVPVAIKTRGGAASAQAAQWDWTLILLTLGFVVILGVLLAVLIAPRRRPPDQTQAPLGKAEPQAPAEHEEAPAVAQNAGELAVARPVPQPEQQFPLPPPPPPPQSPDTIPSARTYPIAPGPLPPVPPPSVAPPPVASPVPSGPPPKGTPPDASHSRPSPLDGYSIPGAEQEPRYASPPQKPKSYTSPQVPMRVCPSCGNEVKMRFVKCPICGADLPPVG